MKNAMVSIFIMQLLSLTIIGSVLFFQNRHIDLLYRGNSIIQVAVSTEEEYDIFLSWINDHDVSIARISLGSDNNTRVLHTNDLTLNNRVVLLEGQFPGYGEFISDTITGDANQSGIIQRLLPEYSFRIYRLHEPERLYFSASYAINITSEDDLNDMITTLALKGISIQLIDIWNNNPFVVLFSAFSIMQVMLLMIFISSSMMIMLILIIQFVIQQLKFISVLLSMGYNWILIVRTVIINLYDQKIWIGTLGILCITLGTFLLWNDIYRPFHVQIMTIFLITAISLIFIYLFILGFVMTVYFFTRRNRLSLSIKGMKPHVVMQIANCFVKFVSALLFVIAIAILVNLFEQYTSERLNMQSWLDARDIHQVHVNDVGQFIDLAVEVDFHRKTTNLYQYLFMNNNGFFMDADNIWAMELFGEDFPLTGLITYHAPTHITVSPNYFNYNPIITSKGVPVYQELIFSDNVLNLLVPEALTPIHGYLYDEFLDYFSFNRLRVSEIYSDVDGETWDPSTILPLTVNIIPVKDRQYYFTFSPDIRRGTGNRILDPVAVVYTGNFHPSYSYSMVTRVLFFEYINNLDITPNDYIAQIIGMDGIAFVSSVWDMVLDRVSRLQREYISTVLLSLFIVLGYLVTSFSFITNYFARNRYPIIIKAMWGYSAFRRYRTAFIMLFLPIPLVLFVFSIVMNFPFLFLLRSLSIQGIFMVGVFLIGVDVLYFVSMEQLLLKKSINSILKGDMS